MLSVVTAAVVGVVLILTVYFDQAVVIREGSDPGAVDLFSLGWIVVSLVAMYRFKIGMIP